MEDKINHLSHIYFVICKIFHLKFVQDFVIS